MYSGSKSPSPLASHGACDWRRATERAIELAISTGLILAPRRILLDMAAEFKRQAEEVPKAEQIEGLLAA
jgi:hypothetical protein